MSGPGARASFDQPAETFTDVNCMQVHRDRLPPMLDYDVQESIYSDKDRCVHALAPGTWRQR
jgi:hypothetical protein